METGKLEGKWILPLDGPDVPDRMLIGGKAWSIAHMRSLELPVPPAFVVTTKACVQYRESGKMPEGLEAELKAGMAWLQEQTGRSYGDGESPLFVSVRSGAPISMPGMMDTVLNLGINDTTARAMATEFGDEEFARDTYRRFYELYGEIVLKVSVPALSPDEDLTNWRNKIEAAADKQIPSDPLEQLKDTVEAVFRSCDSRRAKRYRKHHKLPDDLGTAVVIQAMIFGNMDKDSGTGVLFSRNPLTGEPQPYGEYLRRAQGEDVVSGKFTPCTLDDMEQAAPAAYEILIDAAQKLELANRDVQDIEFTVQQGQLYLLQSRGAKRSPAAAVRTAVDMCREGRISIEEALQRVNSTQIRSMLSPRLKEGAADNASLLASGLGVSHGIGSGLVVTSADEAERLAQNGQDAVLATPTTSPDDVHGMLAARAVITEQGGSTSHAAVVSRALGLPSVVGCGAGNVTSLVGQVVTVDGENGKIYAGTLDVVTPCETEDTMLCDLLVWARECSPLTVYRPEEAPADALDLEGRGEAADPDRLPELLKGASGACGGSIASDEGVIAALSAGLRYIVADPVLPPLLAAIQAKSSPTSN